jgi:hypothetical protein
VAEPKPYAYKVNRVTISGDCFSGAEIWTTGFFMGFVDADAPSPAGLAAEIAPYWASYFTPGANTVSPYYRTTQVKVSQISADGVTDAGLTDFYTYVTPPTGGGSPSALPAQTSVVCTLTSDLARGAGAKGRMYLPGHNAAVGSNGKMPGTQTANVATALETMFEAINADGDIPGNLILASHGPLTRVFPGPEIHYLNPLNTLITGLRIGDVYDTQRRRRNGLVEVYTSRTIT